MTATHTTTSDQQLHEINRYNDRAFPVGIYTVTREGILPDGRGYQDLHWHEELQLTRVECGDLDIRVDGIDYTLHQDEAILINRNLLHVTSNLSENGKYISLNFPDQLLGFFPGSRMEQDYVFPYTRTYQFSAIVLRPDTDWQKQILTLLNEILTLMSKNISSDVNNPEYQIAVRLTMLWSVLIQNMSSSLAAPSKTYLRRQERIHTMLSFIHEHYAEEIHLKDIAATAHISVGECCRCFQSMVRTSPNQYLLEYRISKSKEFLTGTDLSVTETAYAVGFNDSSYFIQYFKKCIGITPKEYIQQSGKC